MASRSAFLRPGKSLFQADACIFCRARLIHQSIYRHSTSESSFGRRIENLNWRRNASLIAFMRRNYATRAMQKGPQEVRSEADTRQRAAFFELVQAEGIIAMDPKIANEIITHFLELKNIKDPSGLIKELATKHKLRVSDITDLALAILRIPGIEDKSGRLPPSQHPIIAKSLLLACSTAQDPAATLHILGAVLWSRSVERAGHVASLLSPAEVRICRQELERLASTNHSEAKTLLGHFLEREGSKAQAKELYEQAMETVEYGFTHSPKESFTLPQTRPWNALGLVLLEENSDESLQQAREAFRWGALEGDDPLSYYYLASHFEEKSSGNWLQYMSKAAGSGHQGAMYQVANFYMDIDGEDMASNSKASTQDQVLVRSLRWLHQRKAANARDLGIEYFQVAAAGGHKPSMLELAELAFIEGRDGKAIEWLETIARPPPKGKEEEWPSIAAEAKRRLQRLDIQSKPKSPWKKHTLSA